MISERLFEVVLVAVVIAIVLAFVAAEFRDFTRHARVLALKSDLRTIRAAVNHYRSRYNTYAPSIAVALRKGGGRSLKFKLRNVDKAGHACDPFGRRYFYNPSTGEVRSQTPGCEKY